jgi:hypothetical protein
MNVSIQAALRTKRLLAPICRGLEEKKRRNSFFCMLLEGFDTDKSNGEVTE